MTTDKVRDLFCVPRVASRAMGAGCAGQWLTAACCRVWLAVLLAGTWLMAQVQPLAPTADMTITVPAGGLHFSSIAIPAGVTVWLVLPAFTSWPPPFVPTVIRCDGDAIVHGTMSVSGEVRNGIGWPAGIVAIGDGVDGVMCGGSYVGPPPSGGMHAGAYGSVFPFSLEGGSSGGQLIIFSDPNCWQYQGYYLGGAGGGTLVLLAGGRIDVHGTITADGQLFISGGSGGSILLRGDAGVHVMPGGTVTAVGGLPNGGPGYIRLDAWGAPPSLQGTITPAPAVVELPYLRSLTAPRIGTTWLLHVHAPENSPVFVSASLQAGPGTPTPFGSLGLDLGTSASVALVTTFAGLYPHDPMATAYWPIPNGPALIGLSLWVQGIAVPPALPPRLTNTLTVVVG